MTAPHLRPGGHPQRPAGPRRVPATERIRVLVADDHVLYRRGLEMVLGQEPDIEIVGEAGDGAEAVARSEELVPDIVLMDVRMPRLSGPDATARLREVVPSAKVVMLTISDEEQDLYAAVRAGATGYLLKDVPGEEIAAGIRQVAAGQSLISPPMASKLLQEFAQLIKREEERPAMPVPRLTERELQVLKLVARGMANKDIATELFISENTVKNHVRNILEKLQLHSRMEAVVFAVREKILDLPE
ncbi:response regulator [Arsenicicoccus sp. oral taxon 190]|uniref:response regulator n=1 Tax=Arsenicicoccus sp. oral taxon 190 TaxID=1658671 RepID=UPI00067A28B7|nr:response regulator transcription factor [Arsenicicoccus sp. oral taxon 190]AKT52703.1 chemotaxis protein CheY [Arsenicicoccus sp. oral taxon 190]